ncbi:MAG: restriction endonuclease subunit S [Firmicutes bacterium]|nr:restriction endonuclease subunit S [Bacillota bacterium]
MGYVRLEEICNLNMGQSPDSNSYNQEGKGLPFFQGNADFGELYPTVRVWCSKPVKVVNEGTLLISVRAPIGALNFAAECSCIGRGLAGITAREGYELKYIYYALKYKGKELNDKGTGSTFKAISKSSLGETLVRDISIEEQKECVKKLDLIFELILKEKEQIGQLDKLVKSKFVEMFGDVICNSKNWPARTLDSISSSRLGKMLDTKKDTGKISFPYLANFNVQWFEFDLSDLHEMDFDMAEREEFSLRDGDLLITEGGEVGRCAIWHNEVKDCYFQKALHRVRCNKDIILPEYLAWWFRFHSDFNGFEDIVGGKATIAHLPGVKLKKLQIVVPDIDVQKEFLEFWLATDKLKVVLQKQIEETNTLFDSLMQQYFS